MVKISIKLKTYCRLGLGNILRVVTYRFGKRIGYYRYCLPIGRVIYGPFLSDSASKVIGRKKLNYFSYHYIQSTSPPDWFINPWNAVRCENPNQHWGEVSDFMPELEDIKTVWEQSRFDWLPRMAWAYHNGDGDALGRLELWLRDWAERNPVNSGINWKCGQEASLRCLNLLVASLVINNCFDSPHKGLLQFLSCHLNRVMFTLKYAMGQDNNHGISEAAALFVVGGYLSVHGNRREKKNGQKWNKLGRYWLQNRVKKLIMSDGSFSQHSVTYHRMMLDVISLVELLRERLNENPFDNVFYGRVKLAVLWLQQMIDSRTGDAPNLGANDGAYLFNLTGKDYRDFRPSVQLGAALFLRQSAWRNTAVHPLLELFGVDLLQLNPLEKPTSHVMMQGGYALLRNDHGYVMLRLPVYKFRPSHADALQLDVWYEGVNWVRDSGSYSYNAGNGSFDYFPSTKSHSTVCFDSRDQMPRLGRFLFGAWLKPDEVDYRKEHHSIKSGYTDYMGASHSRTVTFKGNNCCVIDSLKGFETEAVLRWHLAPADWSLEKNILSCDRLRLEVSSDATLQFSLVELPESLYYLEQHKIPVLEIKCMEDCEITTTMVFTPELNTH